MKIRCGSHQQNRSIVRPGLSLMATKVALTAEEFRENSQRSIDLFNTEKLSTDSTHVLKSAYCILCISAVAICTERVEAKEIKETAITTSDVAICTERVEAKLSQLLNLTPSVPLQSARSVWRQSFPFPPAACRRRTLQSARSVWRQREDGMASAVLPVVAICTERVEAKFAKSPKKLHFARCNLHGACGGKVLFITLRPVQ